LARGWAIAASKRNSPFHLAGMRTFTRGMVRHFALDDRKVYLASGINFLASAIAAITLLFYLLVYTPLKRRTPLCKLFGAIVSAAPPLIGWAASSGGLSREAWFLYGVLFLWQFPHFMAIAWMYREDYDRADYCVLPAGVSRDRLVAVQTMLPLLVLLPVSLLVASGGHARILNYVGSSLLGLGFFYYGLRFVISKSNSAARRLLLASVIYLPALCALLIVLRITV